MKFIYVLVAKYFLTNSIIVSKNRVQNRKVNDKSYTDISIHTTQSHI